MFLLSGCSTTYKKYGGWGAGGYLDEEIEPGKHSIQIIGTEGDDKKTLREFWHRRASELCPEGYTGSPASGTSKKTSFFMGYPSFSITKEPYAKGIAECK